MPEIGNLWVRIGAKIDEFEQGLRNVESSIKEAEKRFEGFRAIGDRLSGIGQKLSLGVTLPVTIMGGAAIKAAADFESMQNTFQAVSGAASDQMAKMSELAKALGNDLTLPGTSASDAAAAMTELVKAGLSIDQTFAAAKGTLQLAAAAQIGNAEAATIVGRALNAFSLAGDKAVQVADLLANSANASAGEITDMAYALQSGASVAAMAGQSINDFTTAVSLMANAGVIGSDAGTSLKTMFMALLNPTDKAAAIMEEYGISVYDAHGNMLPLPALVEQFSTKLGGLSEQQRNAALATIFGTDAVRAANIVLMSGADAWNQMSQAVNRAGGAQDVAAAKMKGFQGAFEAFKSTLETLAITIGERLLPILTPMVQRLTEMVDWFGKLPQPVQMAIIGIAGLAATIGPVLIVLGQMMTAVASVSSMLPLLGVAFTALTGPVGIAAVAIAGIAALAYLIVENWEPISGFFQNVWNSIKTAVVNAANDVLNFLRQWGPLILAAAAGPIGLLVYAVVKYWDDIKSFTSQTWDTIKNGVVAAFQWMYDHNYYFQALVDFIKGAWNTIKEFSTTIWNGIKDTLIGIWDTIKEVMTERWQAIHDVTIIIWTSIAGWLSDLWTQIQGQVTAAWNQIYGVISGVWNRIREGFSNLVIAAWDWGRNLLNNFIEGFKSMLPRLWDAIKEAADAVADFLGFHSPTKLGPGREADKWAPNLVQMYAEGIQASLPKLRASLNEFALNLYPVGIISVAAATAAPAGGSTVNYGGFTINIYGGSASDQADQLLRELAKRGVRL